MGRSHECDHPAAVAALPALTAPKFDPDGTSYAIDERVKALLQEGMGVYRVDAERLRELAPDVVVTQTHCEVCAASLPEVEAALCEWLGQAPRLVALQPNRLEDVWDDIRRVAEAVGDPASGERLAADLKARLDAVSRAAHHPRPGAPAGAEPTDGAAGLAPAPPRVACIEWLDPLMAAGNWVPELVELAGGENLFGRAGEHSPWLQWDDIVAADPDVIVILPCGFGIARTRSELDALTGREGWADLAAVRAGRVAIADGHHYFNRPGPRLVESLEILTEILHPARCDFGHRGTGWVAA